MNKPLSTITEQWQAPKPGPGPHQRAGIVRKDLIEQSKTNVGTNAYMHSKQFGCFTHQKCSDYNTKGIKHWFAVETKENNETHTVPNPRDLLQNILAFKNWMVLDNASSVYVL